MDLDFFNKRRKIVVTSVKSYLSGLFINNFDEINNQQYCKFIILARSRTGSNMMKWMLNNHPEIEVAGELFLELGNRRIDKVLKELFCEKPTNIKAVGFKIFYYHPLDDNSGVIWRCLKKISNLKIIHLKRRNILRALTSRKIADITNIFVDNKESDEIVCSDLKKVSFKKKELIKGFEETRKWEETFDRKFHNFKKLNVYYENLITYEVKEIERIESFLGVQKLPLKTSTRHLNPEPLSELIANYDELKDYFKNTKWYTMFDD